MPYAWSSSDESPDSRRLDIWPHRSLSRRGFAGFIIITSAMFCLPLLALMGTMAWWGLLPFFILVVAAVWFAIEASYRSGRLHEALTISDEEARLVRTNPRGDQQEWNCNSYWTKVNMHPKGGPVEHYVTLAGAGREVEIGAFLSVDERKALYAELIDAFRNVRGPG